MPAEEVEDLLSSDFPSTSCCQRFMTFLTHCQSGCTERWRSFTLLSQSHIKDFILVGIIRHYLFVFQVFHQLFLLGLFIFLLLKSPHIQSVKSIDKNEIQSILTSIYIYYFILSIRFFVKFILVFVKARNPLLWITIFDFRNPPLFLRNNRYIHIYEVMSQFFSFIYTIALFTMMSYLNFHHMEVQEFVLESRAFFDILLFFMSYEISVYITQSFIYLFCMCLWSRKEVASVLPYVPINEFDIFQRQSIVPLRNNTSHIQTEDEKNEKLKFLSELDVYHFQKEQEEKDQEDSSIINPQCAICLNYYEDDIHVCILPCSHDFHFSCLREWLITHNHCTCPFCRSTVKEMIQEKQKNSTLFQSPQ